MREKHIYNEALRELEQSRDHAHSVLEQRTEQVYASVPRIKEIDLELRQSSIRIAQAILAQSNEAKNLIEELKIANELLIVEKNRLLAENQFPEGFFSAVYSCEVCRDTGYAGQIMCGCLKQKLIQKAYGLSNLSPNIENECFETFDLRYYSEQPDSKNGISPYDNMKSVLAMCERFVRNFDESFENILLHGETGLGKTFLCNCIARELLDKGKTVFYATAAQLFKRLSEIRFGKNTDGNKTDLSDIVLTADLLIIDDLGAEFQTVVTDSELFNIINTRLLDQKHTIISTNLSPAALKAQYFERITSRLTGNYSLLKFFGEDIRQKKRFGL